MAQIRSRGQITSKGKNKWLVRYFRGKDADGKKLYSSKLVEGNKSAAQRFLTKKLGEIDSGTYIEPSSLLISEYLKQWLEEIAKPRLRQRTFEQYKWIVENYIGKALGTHKLSELQAYQIQKLYNDMKEKGLSARTIRYTHIVLSSALKQAVRWRIIVQNNCDLCEVPRQQKTEMKYFDSKQTATFLKTARSNKWYVLFLLAIETGMRPSEYLGLKWQDIDLEKKVLSVRRSLVWQNFSNFSFTEPKTAKSRRIIPFSENTKKVLKAYRKKQLELKLKSGADYQNHDLVFATSIGTPLMSKNLIRRHFRPLITKAELPMIRLYDLRHTMATLLLLAGENPKVVSERLGHASITLTLDTYSHVLPSMQETATVKLEKMMFGR